MHYVGLFKNKIGYARLFKSTKKITPERFPFYKKVHAFETKEDAEKFFKKKGLKSVGKKRAAKKVRATRTSKATKAKKVKSRFTITQLKGKLKVAQGKLESARLPSTRLKYKKKIVTIGKLMKAQQRVRRNPGKAWHEEERDLAIDTSEGFEGVGLPKVAEHFRGQSRAHDHSIDELEMHENPLGASMIIAGNPVVSVKRRFLIEKLNELHERRRNARSMAEKALSTRQIHHYKALLKQQESEADPCEQNPATMSRGELAEHISHLDNKIRLAVDAGNVGLARSLNKRIKWLLESSESGELNVNPQLRRGRRRKSVTGKIDGYDKLLARAIRSYRLAVGTKREARLLERLKNAILAYHSEDKSVRDNPPRGSTEIYGEILAIEAVKGDHGEFPNEKFRHDFKNGGKIIGLDNGDLLVTAEDGKLWDTFNY